MWKIFHTVLFVMSVTAPGTLGGFWSADPTLPSDTEDAECDWLIDGEMSQDDTGSTNVNFPTDNTNYGGTGTPYRPGTGTNAYNPSFSSTGYNPSVTSTGYNPSWPSTGYNPSGTSTGYNPSWPSTGYNPSGTSNGYNPLGTSNGYNPSGTSNGYNPSATSNGYNPSATSNGYNPSATSNGYNPSGTANGYNPSVTSSKYNPYGQNSYNPSSDSTGYNPYAGTIGTKQNTAATGYDTTGYYPTSDSSIGYNRNKGTSQYSLGTGDGTGYDPNRYGGGSFNSDDGSYVYSESYVNPPHSAPRYFKRQLVSYMDPYSYPGLHPRLPIGSYVMVTQPETKKSVRVQIVGRPKDLAVGRCLTLSRIAFSKIADLSDGVTHCIVTPTS